MYCLIMSKRNYFIKFKIIFYFKNLLPTFSFYPPPHGLPPTYTSWYQFPPTGIKPKISSFPKISLSSFSYPPSHGLPPPTHHGINSHQPESNPRPLHSQRSVLAPLLPTKCQATSPQARMHMILFKMSIYHISSL
jgi:hypothetical protein